MADEAVVGKRYLFPQQKKRLREVLHAEQGGLCFWCEQGVNLESMTLDHVVPLGLGGSHDRRNLVGTCYPCNNDRGYAFTFEHWVVAHPEELAVLEAGQVPMLDRVVRVLKKRKDIQTFQSFLALLTALFEQRVLHVSRLPEVYVDAAIRGPWTKRRK